LQTGSGGITYIMDKCMLTQVTAGMGDSQVIVWEGPCEREKYL
jgi:hypothetical protein